MKLALTLMSLMALVGCAAGPAVVGTCPALAPPPAAAIDALERAGRADPSTASWVVDLSRHYDRLDVCHGTR